eukprot:m.26240 g.26240  ORF g.26240 m.26240 type:complete len:478 (+) comp11677_c0_seq2:45-1478(+)
MDEPLLIDSTEDVPKARITPFLALAIFVAVLGGTFQFGYNLGVINSPQNVIELSLSGCNASQIAADTCKNTVTTGQWSAVVSLFAIGGLFGALLGGPLVPKVGLRLAFLSSNVIMTAGALLMALAPNVTVLVLGRVVIGVAGGLTTVLTPMYLAAIAPYAYKGAVGTMTQLGVTSGLFLSQILSLSSIWGTANSWRLLLGLPLVFAAVQTLALAILPESPVWLITCDKHDKARASLARLRGSPRLARYELAALIKDTEQAPKSQSLSELLRLPAFRRVVLIGIGLQACQQLTGINAIFYFSTSIFQSANVKNEDSATLAVGGLALMMTVASVQFMDKFNRKTLLIGGLIGMPLFFACLTIASMLPESHGVGIFAIMSVCGVVISFAAAPGNIPWLMIGEMFPAEMLAPATSLCVGANWIFNFIVGISFQGLEEALSYYVYVVFLVIGLMCAGFVWKFVPETRGKAIADTAAALQLRT